MYLAFILCNIMVNIQHKIKLKQQHNFSCLVPLQTQMTKNIIFIPDEINFLYLWYISCYTRSLWGSLPSSKKLFSNAWRQTGSGSEQRLLLAQSPTVFALKPENTEQCDFIKTWHRSNMCCIKPLYCRTYKNIREKQYYDSLTLALVKLSGYI